MSETSPGSWQPDPYGRFAQRYWDGANWTENVSDAAGVQTTDPPVPGAGPVFTSTSSSGPPVPGLLVAGFGALLLLLSLFALNWFDLSKEAKTDLRLENPASVERETGVAASDLVDGIKLSELRDIADAGGGEDIDGPATAYRDWGYIVALLVAAFAFVVLLAKPQLKIPAVIAAAVMVLWHGYAVQQHDPGNEGISTAFGAWLGAIGLVAVAVALLLPRPRTAA